MTLTHEALLAAVRDAGRDGQPFSCADIRQRLDLSTGDRQQLSQFHRRFRTFQKAAQGELEKLGTNSYRLRTANVGMDVSSERLPEVASPQVLEASAPVCEPTAPVTAFEPPLYVTDRRAAATALAAQLHASGDGISTLELLASAFQSQATALLGWRERWLGRRVAQLFGRS